MELENVIMSTVFKNRETVLIVTNSFIYMDNYRKLLLRLRIKYVEIS